MLARSNAIHDDHPRDLTTAKDILALSMGTSSASLSVEAAVEDMAEAIFHYNVTSSSGRRKLSPCSFVEDYLFHATQLKMEFTHSGLHAESLPTDLKDAVTFSVAHGEGDMDLPVSFFGLVLRPHKGNMLGQCVALSWELKRLVTISDDAESLVSERLVIISNDAEPHAFLGWYAEKVRKALQENKDVPGYVVLFA